MRTTTFLSGLMAGGLLLTASQTPAHAADAQKVEVFFSEWSALVDPDATEAVRHAADIAKQGSGHKVTVTGYTDTTGSEQANKLLAQLRSQIVTDQLTADGVPADSITQKADAEAPSPPDSKQESRRVAITIE